MSKIYGYGEDSFTLWTLKQHTSKILGRFHDKTALSKCLTFYRPSFGKHHGKEGSAFGEFDAIMVSAKNVYLIDTTWDARQRGKRKIPLEKSQKLRHEIFSWYLTHWDKKYRGHWKRFAEEHRNEFKFGRKTLPPKNSIQAANLEFILTKTLEQCKTISRRNIKNVLLFCYRAQKPRKPPRIDKPFKLIPIDCSRDTKDNFVVLYDEARRLTQIHKSR